jgi:integrase
MYNWVWNILKVSGIRESSFERYEGIYRNYVENTELGYLRLKDIQRITIQKYYTELYEQGKSYSQIKNAHKLINMFFKYAVIEGYLLRNPCEGINLEQYKTEETIDELDLIFEEEGEIETFTDDEISIILDEIKNKKLKILVKFALGTGLRQGEILALTKSDIKDMEVRVTKSLSNVKVFDDSNNYTYQLKVTKPKTKSSIRKVPIPTELKKDLVELNKIRNEEQLKLGELYNENNLLFPSSTGTYIDSRNLIRAWTRVFKNINVPYKKFHALRHTYATQLLKSGSQLITVSRLLGHSSIKTTEIYAHVLESTKIKDVESLNILFK